MFKLFKAKLVVALAAVGLALGARAITNEDIQYYLMCKYLDFEWWGDVSLVYDYGYAVKIAAEGQDKYSELETHVYGPCLLEYTVKSSTTDGSSAHLVITDPEGWNSFVNLKDYTSYEDIVRVISDEGLNVLLWRASTPVDADGSASLNLKPLSVWPRVTFDMTGCTGMVPDLTEEPLNDEQSIKVHSDGNTYAIVGKRIKLPTDAATFSKNGWTLDGWYVRRANAERDEFYTPGDFVTMTLEPITIRPSWIENENNETSGYAAQVESYNDAIGCDQLNFFSWGWQAGEGAGGDSGIKASKANHTIEIMADGSGRKTHIGASFEAPCYLEYKWKATASGGDASDEPYFHTEIYRDGADNVVKYKGYNNEFSSTSVGFQCDAKNGYEFGKDKDILTVTWETDNSNYSGKTTLTLGGVGYYPVLKVNLSSADHILNEYDSVAYWGSGVSAKECWFSNYCFKPGKVITLPGAENIKFSKDGYHLAGWEIEGTDYAIGANYTMPGRPVEMKPIWEEGGELKQLLGCDYLDFTSATVGGGEVNNKVGTDFLRLEASGNNGLAEIGSGVKGPCYIGYVWVGEANTGYAEGYFKYQDALTLQTETVNHALDGTISPMVLLPLAQDYSIIWGVTTQGAGASAEAHVDLSNVTVYPGIMFDYGGATGAAQPLTDVQEEEGLVFENNGIFFAPVGTWVMLPGPGTLAKDGYKYRCWKIGTSYYYPNDPFKINTTDPVTIEVEWVRDYGKYLNCDYLNLFDYTAYYYTGDSASVDVDTEQNQVCLAALGYYSEACLYTPDSDPVAGPGIVKYDWNGRQNTTGGYAKFKVFDYDYWDTVVEQCYNKLGTETTSGSAIAYLPEYHEYQIQWRACIETDSAGGGTYWNLSNISYWPRFTFDGGDATGEAPKLSDVPANMATFCMTGEDGYSYAKAKSWIVLPGAGSFSKAGYHLAGWKIGEEEYAVSALLQMPVTPVTATAIWVEGEEEEPEDEWPGLVYDNTEFGAKGAWNGYFIDDDGVVVGTINIKAAAFKKGKSAATFTVTLKNNKALKIKSNVIKDEVNGYWTEATTKSGDWVEAYFTNESVYGWVNGVFFDAGRDFTSDKGDAAAAFKKRLDGAKKDFVLAGTSTPLSGKKDLQNGYIGVTVNIAAKGKIKFSGVLPDGNKISGKGVALVDSRGVYVPLWTQIASKKGYFGGQMISADTLQPMRNPAGWWIAPQVESSFDFVDAQLLKNSKPAATCTLWAIGAPETIDGMTLDATTIPGWSEPMSLTFSKGKAWTPTSANPGKLKLTYVPKTGLIKGNFTAVSGKKKFKATINGAYVGKEGFANAFFKGKRSFGIWME